MKLKNLARITMIGSLVLTLVACENDNDENASPPPEKPGTTAPATPTPVPVPGPTPGAGPGTGATPQPQPTPFSVVSPIDGSIFEATVSSDGRSIDIVTPPANVQVVLKFGIVSMNIGFIDDRGSVENGCKKMKATRARMQQIIPDTDYAEFEMKLEAGYLSMKNDLPEWPNELVRAVIRKANDLGFVKATTVRPMVLEPGALSFGAESFLKLTGVSDKDVIGSFVMMAQGMSTSLTNAYVCDILNGDVKLELLFRPHQGSTNKTAVPVDLQIEMK